MRCARCLESCSERGHVRGEEVSRSRSEAVYACLRCDWFIVQELCECCGVESGQSVARRTKTPPPPPKPAPEPEPEPQPKREPEPAPKKPTKKGAR